MKTGRVGHFAWSLWLVSAALGGVAVAFKENLASVMHYFIGVLSEGFLSFDNTIVIVMILSPFFPRKKELEKILLASMGLAILARFILIKIGYALIGTSKDISLISGVVLIVVSLLCLFSKQEIGETSWVGKLITKIKLRGEVGTKFKKYASITVLLLGAELINIVLSIDSLSVAFSNSNKPFVVYFASFIGIIMSRLFGSHPGLYSKIIRFKKVIAGAILCVGIKTLLF